MNWFSEQPGRLYVAATLLPLAAAALLLVAGGVRRLFPLTFGTRPRRAGAYLSTAAITLSAVLAVVGLVRFLGDDAPGRWAERIPWAAVSPSPLDDGPRPALALEIGYRIDRLNALLFVMVTVVAALIHVFALGYLREEGGPEVTDHDLHLRRRGRLGRFYLYLSLFCFSMLNLLIADNLFQVFVSWELVGVCSFFLIGFYYERPAASLAANKAFVVNRVGDAGFLVGIAVLWSAAGTLNFEELAQRLRSPLRDVHGDLVLGGGFVRVAPKGPADADGVVEMRLPREGEPAGTHLAVFPFVGPRDHFHGLGPKGTNGDQAFDLPPAPTLKEYNALPYWLFVAAGLGLFLGCVGKSAQFPLHTWLPDAMEGPTPVSALIHAATMVAAGVYLVGRAYLLFAPEVLLVVAYTGAVTLALAATIALVQTDIKRVLAYSTVSQLGFMMLALGVGGWAAGELHLLTHAFFKALLFLAAGSVIAGVHHVQDLRQMGGLRRRMPVTAYTTLVGVLAIAGTPFFSGWYSKDQILSAALGYAKTHPEHAALYWLPLATAGLTSLYMFRLWFLAFTGEPRSDAARDARESPAVMTVPLVVLAAFSVAVAWDWRHFRLWDVEAGTLSEVLHEAVPRQAADQFAVEMTNALAVHHAAGVAALVMAGVGFALAVILYGTRWADPARVRLAAGPVARLLERKWYFDELYDALFTRPAVALARWCRSHDRPDDDRPAAVTVDGLANVPAGALYAAGVGLRRAQTGSVRRYVLALALTAAALFAIVSVLTASGGR